MNMSQMVLGLKKEVDRLSKENKTLSKKLERIETQRYAARTPSRRRMRLVMQKGL